MTKLTLVIGAATPPGRLHAAATSFARTLESCDVSFVDLSLDPLGVADGRPLEEHGAPTRSAIASVEDADAVVIFSPVYRASYPGVLKNLLDLMPVAALRSKPVGLVTVGGSLHHYLAVDGHLRMVMGWFGALPAPTSIYLTGKDFNEDKAPFDGTVTEMSALGRTVVALAERLRGADLGPTPLAARAW